MEVEAVGVAIAKSRQAEGDSKSDKGSWCHMTRKILTPRAGRSKLNAARCDRCRVVRRRTCLGASGNHRQSIVAG